MCMDVTCHRVIDVTYHRVIDVTCHRVIDVICRRPDADCSDLSLGCNYGYICMFTEWSDSHW